MDHKQLNNKSHLNKGKKKFLKKLWKKLINN